MVESAVVIISAIFGCLGVILLILLLSWYICVVKVNKEMNREAVVISYEPPESIRTDYHHVETPSATEAETTNNNDRLPIPSPSNQQQIISEIPKAKHAAKKRSISNRGLSIGIDIGTVNSRFAVIDEKGQIRILQNEHGQNITPTCLAAPGDDYKMAPIVYGSIAYAVRKQPSETSSFVTDLPRMTGRLGVKESWQLFLDEAERDKDQDDEKKVVTKLSPTMLLALLLAHIKKQAEASLEGRRVENAVIAVPSCFNDLQRQAYIDASKVAGFKKIRLQSKNTLGMLYYLRNSFQPDEIYNYDGCVLVFRYGGGSMEAAVMKIKRGHIDVIATAGTQRIGGFDLSEALFKFCLEKLEQLGIDVASLSQITKDRLRRDCEKKKVTLSATTHVQLIVEVPDDDIVKLEVTREDLEHLLAHLENDIPSMIDRVLVDSKAAIRIERNSIGHVYLFGGSSRIPKIQALIKQYFDGTATIHISPLDDHAVVEGAAMQAAFLSEAVTVASIRRTKLREVIGFDVSTSQQTVIEATDKLPVEKLIENAAFSSDRRLQLKQSSRYTGNGELPLEIGFGPLEENATTPTQLNLTVDENCVVKLAVADEPTMRLKKSYALSRQAVVGHRKLLNRIEAETDRRRREVDGGVSVLEKIVHAVKGDAGSKGEDSLLVGEDFVS